MGVWAGAMGCNCHDNAAGIAAIADKSCLRDCGGLPSIWQVGLIQGGLVGGNFSLE